ncbi:NUDIX domain-containing protein [Streptomyces clavifer]|uniref:NUDIX domain-containing protein n=1 Tax=Streptomyces clavifer TaxID=68188 RepID=UPI003822ADD1
MTAHRTHIGLPVSQLDAARQTLGDSDPVSVAGTRARDRHSHQLTRRFRPASVQESGNLRASPGGHLEPTDTTLVGAASRELSEETGIDPEQVVPVSRRPAYVEFGQVPARPAKDEPDHCHLGHRLCLRDVRRRGRTYFGVRGYRRCLVPAEPG